MIMLYNMQDISVYNAFMLLTAVNTFETTIISQQEEYFKNN